MIRENLISSLEKYLPRRLFILFLKINRARKDFKSYLLEKKYIFLNKHSNTFGITRNKRSTPVILSGTTFPARIGKVYLTINTLLRQKTKPDHIFLWLANDEFPKGRDELPRSLLDLEKRGLTIKFTDANLLCNNKAFHTMKEFPDSRVITYDDDCFYDSEYTKHLLIANKKYPNDVIGYDAMQIKLDKKGNILPYNSWFTYIPNNEARHDTFLLNVNGIIYPTKLFPKETFNIKALKSMSIYADDIWMKAMAMKAGIKHRRLFKHNKKYPEVLGTQKTALFHENVNNNRNDKIINTVFKKYKLLPILQKNIKY
jgi:hypothetical protein